MNYSTLAFSAASKSFQTIAGSRKAYERMDQEQTDGLTSYETDFIGTRDGFYLSTIGENGFPYIQFRGGPKGFLKVLDRDKLGFVDFRGNKQYISAGNLMTNKKAALFFMDYASQTRLKIYAEAELVDLKDNPQLLQKLTLTDYKYHPERMMVFKVLAFSWNCPQHITPRYTVSEMQDALAEQHAYIEKLETELKDLRAQSKTKSA
jgi:predicted pyridoxine 5'-phosphate oxidase superfamily flavin-nucleotide-binding protein